MSRQASKSSYFLLYKSHIRQSKGRCEMHEVHYLDDHDIIEVRHWGAVSESDVRDARSAVEALIEQTSVSDVLVDLSSAESFLDTIEIYEFASEFDHTMRIAMLIENNEKVRDDLLFLETVAVNRGNDFSTHDNRDDALRWLRP